MLYYTKCVYIDNNFTVRIERHYKHGNQYYKTLKGAYNNFLDINLHAQLSCNTTLCGSAEKRTRILKDIKIGQVSYNIACLVLLCAVNDNKIDHIKKQYFTVREIDNELQNENTRNGIKNLCYFYNDIFKKN